MTTLKDLDNWPDAPFHKEVRRRREAAERNNELSRFIKDSHALRDYGRIALIGNTMDPQFQNLHEQVEVLAIVQDYIARGFDPADDRQRHLYLERFYTAAGLSQPKYEDKTSITYLEGGI
jgi:hypothetical protein